MLSRMFLILQIHKGFLQSFHIPADLLMLMLKAKQRFPVQYRLGVVVCPFILYKQLIR